MTGLVAKEWARYAEAVLPTGVGEVQQQETKRAFYGGALALFSGILSRLTPGSEPMQEDLDFMQSIEDEFKAWQRDLVEGRA